MIFSGVMKYILSAVLLLYSVTTFHMISWTFQQGRFKPAHQRSNSSRRYVSFPHGFMGLFVQPKKQQVNNTNVLQPSMDRQLKYLKQQPSETNNTSSGFNHEKGQLRDYNSSSNGKVGRKRKILSQLWQEYYSLQNKLASSENTVDHFKTISEEIFIFSAFYDDRLHAEHNGPIVRLVGISSLSSTDALLCSFDDDISRKWKLAKSETLSDDHERKFGAKMYVCNTPSDLITIPDHVFLTSINNMNYQHRSKINIVKLKIYDSSQISSKNNQNTNEYLKFSGNAAYKHQNEHRLSSNKEGEQLQRINSALNLVLPPIHSKSVKEIALCIPPLYGDISLQNFIQFIEIHRILGISHIFFYPMDTSKGIMNLLRFYEIQNMVSIIPWQLPDRVKSDIWYNGQVAAIQDCLYRTMDQFELVAFLDVDEVIVPKLADNWSDMVNSIEESIRIDSNNHTIAAYRFKSAFFDASFTDDSTNDLAYKVTGGGHRVQGQRLPFFKALHRTETASSVRTKLIVKPYHIEHMGIHHVSKLFNVSPDLEPVYSSDLDICNVAITTALIHHYRKCTVNTIDADVQCHKTVLDDSILKFETNLHTNYNKIVKEYNKFVSTVNKV